MPSSAISQKKFNPNITVQKSSITSNDKIDSNNLALMKETYGIIKERSGCGVSGNKYKYLKINPI